MANPNKPQPIVDILANNRDKLLKFLEEFHTERGAAAILVLSLQMQGLQCSRMNAVSKYWCAVGSSTVPCPAHPQPVYSPAANQLIPCRHTGAMFDHPPVMVDMQMRTSSLRRRRRC